MGKGRATLAAGTAVGVAAAAAVVRNRRGRAEARPVVSAANARESLGRLVGKGRASWEDLAAEFTPSSVHAVELLVEGVQFFPRIVEDLRRATSSIHIIEFGFLPGHIADEVNAVLIEKARSGVGVRVVVDENGSKTAGQSKAMYQELAAAGVETVVNNAMSPVQLVGPIGSARRRVGVRHLAHLDHRKVFVIDGRVGYVGGAGIEDHFFDGQFHDLFVRVEGALVAQLQYLFGASFMRLGGRLPGDEANLDRLFPDPSLPETRLVVPARLLQNVPTARSHSISDILRPFIDEATASLDVINPYLTDRRLIRRLVAAAERGVKTRLVLPERPNSFAALAIHRHYYPPCSVPASRCGDTRRSPTRRRWFATAGTFWSAPATWTPGAWSTTTRSTCCLTIPASPRSFRIACSVRTFSAPDRWRQRPRCRGASGTRPSPSPRRSCSSPPPVRKSDRGARR